ncbi:hypothetical protein L1887_40496 [Cichorium endivia]|nr:hypothetical protein L1887_40496 [Cichorium endivia]
MDGEQTRRGRRNCSGLGALWLLEKRRLRAESDGVDSPARMRRGCGVLAAARRARRAARSGSAARLGGRRRGRCGRLLVPRVGDAASGGRGDGAAVGRGRRRDGRGRHALALAKRVAAVVHADGQVGVAIAVGERLRLVVVARLVPQASHEVVNVLAVAIRRAHAHAEDGAARDVASAHELRKIAAVLHGDAHRVADTLGSLRVVLATAVVGAQVHHRRIVRARDLHVLGRAAKVRRLDESVGHGARAVGRVDAVAHRDRLGIHQILLGRVGRHEQAKVARAVDVDRAPFAIERRLGEAVRRRLGGPAAHRSRARQARCGRAIAADDRRRLRLDQSANERSCRSSDLSQATEWGLCRRGGAQFSPAEASSASDGSGRPAKRGRGLSAVGCGLWAAGCGLRPRHWSEHAFPAPAALSSTFGQQWPAPRIWRASLNAYARSSDSSHFAGTLRSTPKRGSSLTRLFRSDSAARQNARMRAVDGTPASLEVLRRQRSIFRRLVKTPSLAGPSETRFAKNNTFGSLNPDSARALPRLCSQRAPAGSARECTQVKRAHNEIRLHISASTKPIQHSPPRQVTGKSHPRSSRRHSPRVQMASLDS